MSKSVQLVSESISKAVPTGFLMPMDNHYHALYLYLKNMKYHVNVGFIGPASVDMLQMVWALWMELCMNLMPCLFHGFITCK